MIFFRKRKQVCILHKSIPDFKFHFIIYLFATIKTCFCSLRSQPLISNNLILWKSNWFSFSNLVFVIFFITSDNLILKCSTMKTKSFRLLLIQLKKNIYLHQRMLHQWFVTFLVSFTCYFLLKTEKNNFKY